MKSARHFAAVVFIVFIVGIVSAAPRTTPLRGSTPEELLRQIAPERQINVILGVRVEGGWNPADNVVPAKGAKQIARMNAAKARVLRAHAGKLKVSRDYKHIPFFSATVDEAALRALIDDDDITSIEGSRNIERVLMQSTNIVQSRAANLRGYGGYDTIVVIVDDGINSAHPFFGGRVVEQACFTFDCQTEGYPAGEPCGSNCNHGTQVAGVVAGSSVSNNLYGVAPQAMISSVRVFHETLGNVGGRSEDVVAALDWLYGRAQYTTYAAVNLSLVLAGQFSTRTQCVNAFPGLHNAIANLHYAGIAVVAAAGNDGSSLYRAPACAEWAYSVGATLDNDTFASSYSNYSPNVSLLAPGGNGAGGAVFSGQGIYSAHPGGVWSESYGTSLAAPHVTGAFAVLRSAAGWQPSLTTLYDALRSTGTPVTVVPGAPAVPRINVDAAVRVFQP